MMALKRSLIVLSSLLFLNACSSKEPEVREKIVVEQEFIEQSIPIQPRPRKVNLKDVKWYVVTEDNIEEFKSRFVDENGRLVFAAVSIEGYEALAINFSELERYIRQQQDIIVFYEEFTR